jgi:hypothetical protein
MFSLVNSLLLRSLPVKEPARLVLLRSHEQEGYPEWSYPVWDDLRQRRQLFESAAAWSPTARANFFIDGVAQKADGFFASGSFFDTLGVTPLVGRTFSEADDRPGGGPDGPVAVLSHAFWQRQFNGDAGALGRTVTLEDVPFTFLGARCRPRLRRHRAARHRAAGQPGRGAIGDAERWLAEHHRASTAGPDAGRRDRGVARHPPAGTRRDDSRRLAEGRDRPIPRASFLAGTGGHRRFDPA